MGVFPLRQRSECLCAKVKDRKLPLLAKTEEADATEKRELRREGYSEVVESVGMGAGVGGWEVGVPSTRRSWRLLGELQS